MCLLTTHVHVPMEAWKCRVFGAGLQVAMSCPAWVLGLELRSSGRAVWAVSPGPILYCFFVFSLFFFRQDLMELWLAWNSLHKVGQASPKLVGDLPASASWAHPCSVFLFPAHSSCLLYTTSLLICSFCFCLSLHCSFLILLCLFCSICIFL